MLVGVGVAWATRQSALYIWNRLDTQWYLGIATHGYHWSLHGKSALAFFPLYPLCIHLAMRLGIDGVLAGMLIANAAWLGALFYLHRWIEPEWGERTARRAIWLLALLPTAFFTFAPYTEGPFLLCAAGALVHARERQGWLAGLWVAAAVMTRSTGLILVLPVIWLLGTRRLMSWIAAILPTALALAVYAIHLQAEHLSVSGLLNSQRAWHRALSFPWTGFVASLEWLVNHSTYNAGWTAENILQLGVTVAFLTFTVLAWRHLQWAERIYSASFWLLILCTSEWRDDYFAPFSSVDRFILALFPLAGWMAWKLTRRQLYTVLIVSGVAMAGAEALHLAGGWVG